MAESELKDCPCSNITIMQLFHELKQNYPKIPDHVVTKVIEQNFHDKIACETILQRESHFYAQSYPSALISGSSRDQNEPLCNQCSAPRTTPQFVKRPPSKTSSESSGTGQDLVPVWRRSISDREKVQGREAAFLGKRSHSEPSRKDQLLPPAVSVTDCTDAESDRARQPVNQPVDSCNKRCDGAVSKENRFLKENSSSSSLGTYRGSITEEEEADGVDDDEERVSSECSAVITDRTSESGCDSETREDNLLRSQSSVESSSPRCYAEKEIETRRWCVEDGGRKSAIISGIISRSPSAEPLSSHNYQVAVECSMQPIPPESRLGRDQTRSFTSVNLRLRPPSCEPQPPIEIQSGQSLTYTTSTFDPKKGFQSQLQIRIDPGGGGTFSACRTYISTPQIKVSTCKPTNCSYHCPGSHRCPSSRHHLRALLEKQRERKDLLARELRREKEKLRCMQNEVRLMKAAISQRPNPHIIPKLKAEILRLRTECEKLTAAVDMYSDNQSNLPLGETDEEFYRNIYTGQRFQREASWSCQLCTFRNHPLLSVCEECEMPRLPLGRRDIHIRVTHHCPPSRTVNSWVV